MGKNKKKHRHSGAAKKSSAMDASVNKVVEDIWKMLQSGPGDQLPVLWAEHDRLQELVSALRRLQGPAPVRPARTSILPIFEKWALENKAIYKEKAEIMETPGSGGFGLRTVADIQKDEVVLHIPEKIMMSSVTAQKGELGMLIKSDCMLQTMPNVALALHLLHEHCNPASFWRPYIDFLPREFSLPLFYSKDELMLLQGSPCLVKSLIQIRNITKLFAHLYMILKSAPDGVLTSLKSNFFYNDFLWAVSCVMSRQNEIPTPAGHTSPTLALIPVWDLCNHSSGSITTFFSVETQTCDCYAMRNFKSKEEFTIFYGQRMNSELLIQQGFAYPMNQFDRLQLKLGLSPKEEEKTKKLRIQLLDRLNLPVSGVYLLNSVSPLVAPNLVAFSRVFTAHLEQLQAWLALDTATAIEALTGDWRSSDVKALQFLDVRCRLLLKTYPCDSQEDERLLHEDPALSDSARQIVTLRKCEKTILSNASEYIQLVKDELEHSK